LVAVYIAVVSLRLFKTTALCRSGYWLFPIKIWRPSDLPPLSCGPRRLSYPIAAAAATFATVLSPQPALEAANIWLADVPSKNQQGPHRRTPKLRVRPGNGGFAPPHLLYKLGGLVRASGFRSGFRLPAMWALVFSELKIFY
jgi:hypothetical protein